MNYMYTCTCTVRVHSNTMMTGRMKLLSELQDLLADQLRADGANTDDAVEEADRSLQVMTHLCWLGPTHSIAS